MVAAPGISGVQEPSTSRVLVVGAGGIGGVVSAALAAAGTEVAVVTRNTAIADALRQHGFRRRGMASVSHPGAVLESPPAGHAFDWVLLAVQPPQVETAARDALDSLAPGGHVVCFQNGLCEERVAAIVGPERVVGAVIAWGASMVAPGVYDRTSAGGFSVGVLPGGDAAAAHALARLLERIGPVTVTRNLAGVRWSKLAINCAVSTLGTLGGERLGSLLRLRYVRRLALEIMTEAVRVAEAEGVQLEKVSGTLDLRWLSLAERERQRPTVSLAAKHALVLAVGARHRRLRSSMLAALERGREPAVDFLNGEIVERARRHGVPVPVNARARELIWNIARGDRASSRATLRELFSSTR